MSIISEIFSVDLLPQVQSFGAFVGRFPVENRLIILRSSSFNSTSKNRWLDSYIYPGIVSNLLKNNNAQEGLKHWDIIQNGGEGFGSGFYNNSVNKGFNTSYGWNIKEQTIDVSKFGALLDETDKVLVGAEFRDVYCGNDYLFLEVELKDEAHNIVKRFSTGKRSTRVPKLCT
jgi:hypothetical protein